MATNPSRSIDFFGDTMRDMVKDAPPGSIGFLSLTFQDHIIDPREAQEKFHSLSPKLRDRFSKFIRVIQPQTSGRVHYHVVGVLKSGADILSGYDYDTEDPIIEAASVNDALRAERAFWDANIVGHPAFGKPVLKPVYRLGGLIDYLDDYMEETERLEDRGVPRPILWKDIKLWVPSGKVKVDWKKSIAGPRFWATVAAMMTHLGIPSLAAFKARFGKKWAYPVIGKKTDDVLAKNATDYASFKDWCHSEAERKLTNLDPDKIRLADGFKSADGWMPYTLDPFFDPDSHSYQVHSDGLKAVRVVVTKPDGTKQEFHLNRKAYRAACLLQEKPNDATLISILLSHIKALNSNPWKYATQPPHPYVEWCGAILNNESLARLLRFRFRLLAPIHWLIEGVHQGISRVFKAARQFGFWLGGRR